MCSRLTSLTVSLARWPMRRGPKLCRVLSRDTFGSTVAPTSKKGTLICKAGILNFQKLSCAFIESGVKSKTISNLRPGSTMPRREWQRKKRLTTASCLSGCASSHRNS
eukprot:6182307-Pleurochrysis_carterae.AAC.1